MPAPPTPSDAGRVLRLAGADNVRDLGGLPAGGRTTLRGRIFRGELLSELVEADVDLLIGRVGLRTVVDLRTRGEVRHSVARWVEHDVEWVHCPFSGLGHAPVPGPGVDYVGAYLGFLESGPEAVRLAARTVMRVDSHPVLFHCAAGKDRTGVLCALLLDVLGVDRNRIAEDYAMTSERLEQVFERLVVLEPYQRTLLGSTAADHAPLAETMLSFLATLDERYGGAEGWLLASGCPDDEIAAFRRSMLAAPVGEASSH
jgi:protein-tyrosine phosphatase